MFGIKHAELPCWWGTEKKTEKPDFSAALNIWYFNANKTTVYEDDDIDNKIKQEKFNELPLNENAGFYVTLDGVRQGEGDYKSCEKIFNDIKDGKS